MNHLIKGRNWYEIIKTDRMERVGLPSVTRRSLNLCLKPLKLTKIFSGGILKIKKVFWESVFQEIHDEVYFKGKSVSTPQSFNSEEYRTERGIRLVDSVS